MPCIKDIEVHCEVYDMDTTTDFRLLGHLRDSTYMVTSNVPDADNRLEKAYDELTAGWTTRPVRLMTQGGLSYTVMFEAGHTYIYTYTHTYIYIYIYVFVCVHAFIVFMCTRVTYMYCASSTAAVTSIYSFILVYKWFAHYANTQGTKNAPMTISV